MALVNLEKVSASLGGKGVLWELFSLNQPCLRLYVELCAWSQFLSEILINNPGMIDELLDSLVLNQPRPAAELSHELAELCRGAADLDPILHSFHDKELLRIGGEMSYHSDLDLILIYEGDGRTGMPPGASRFDRFELTDNFHFFTELARNIIKVTSTLGPKGRLYLVDMRLRPTGKSGSLVIPLNEFQRYYQEGGAQLWERQALTRARVVYGDADFAHQVTETVAQGAYRLDWKPELTDEIRSMRERLEASGSNRDLKRGAGGIIDIEFIVQLYRLKYGWKRIPLRDPNTWATLKTLAEQGFISPTEYATLCSCYDFLRLVESRLRIVHNRTLDELPELSEDLEKLARRLGCEAALGTSAAQRFLEELDRHMSQTRQLFLDIFQRERSTPMDPAD